MFSPAESSVEKPAAGSGGLADDAEKARRIEERIRAGKKTLFDAVRILLTWEDGMPLAELLGRPRKNPALYNGLFLIFRHWVEIEWVLQQVARKKIKRRVRQLLRWAAAHMLYSDRTPPPIVADACVTFARETFHPVVAGFVNAVLRRIGDHRDEWLERLRTEAPEHVRLGFTPVVWERWRKRFPPERLEEFSRLLHTPAPVVIRPLAGARFPDSLPIERIPSPDWAPNVPLYVVLDAQTFFESETARSGSFYAQDPATLLAPGLLAPTPGERIGDLCCAPGGKALCIAERLEGAGELVCMDRSIRRLQRARKNLRPFPAAMFAVADAVAPPLPSEALDGVLLDVPCSNTGVFRRRPDALVRFTEQDIAELVELQAQILDAAARLVRRGGRIVYSTCSIEPEENAQQVERFLARHPEFRLETARELLPCDRHDGAYAALLVRA